MPPPSARAAVSRQFPKPSGRHHSKRDSKVRTSPRAPSREELLERQEVGVPPAVLEDRELHAGVGRPGDEFFTVGRAW